MIDQFAPDIAHLAHRRCRPIHKAGIMPEADNNATQTNSGEKRD